MSDTQPHSTELEREETIRDLEVPARARPVSGRAWRRPRLG